MTKIEWTEQTWNPIVGCSVISPGCKRCYAMGAARRIERMGAAPHYDGLTQMTKAGPVWTGKLSQAPEATLFGPLRRKKPTMYFVNSMSDLFHESVPDDWIDRVFAVMALCPQHTFQVLTKRSGRMREYFANDAARRVWWWLAETTTGELYDAAMFERAERFGSEHPWPLPNVWLGVSTEDQARANERIPDLLSTPAAVRFISAEPLLGPVSLRNIEGRLDHLPIRHDHVDALHPHLRGRLDWVIVGGESGPGARPMHRVWARSLRNHCAAAGVPFFFKQWGEYRPDDDAPDGIATSARRVGKRAAGRLLDGVLHDAMPEPKQ